MKAIIILLAIVVCSYAGPFYLFGSLVSGDAVSGGVGYLATDKICLDVALASNIGGGTSVDFYVDILYGSFGIYGFTSRPKEGGLTTDVGIIYSITKTIGDKVSVGITPILVSAIAEKGADICILPGWSTSLYIEL